MTTQVVVFRLKPGTDLQDFQASIDEITALLQSQHGFISRNIGKAEGGFVSNIGGEGWNEYWLDIMYWESLEDAKKSTAEFLVREAGLRFLGFAIRELNQGFFL